MKTIYETAVDTAKKIRKTLKAAFPGVKFSVTSSTFSMGSSVSVRWTDGPMSSHVDKILNRFKSGYYDGMQDMYESTGYEWEGQIYNGAKYVSGSRDLSPERQKRIEDKLNDKYATYPRTGFHRDQWEKAEQELIDAGELQGFPSQLPEPTVAFDPEPEKPALIQESEQPADTDPEGPRGGKVIPFPVRDPDVIAKLKAEKLMNSLTPEQKLKLQILQTFYGNDEVADMIVRGQSVDDIFKITANRLFQ